MACLLCCIEQLQCKSHVTHALAVDCHLLPLLGHHWPLWNNYVGHFWYEYSQENYLARFAHRGLECKAPISVTWPFMVNEFVTNAIKLWGHEIPIFGGHTR
jgi:hypothetical protein